MGALQEAARFVLRDELAFQHEAYRQQQDNFELLVERIAELELALEDVGWLHFGEEGLDEFSREALRTISRLSRLYYLKNPLVQRGVNVQRYYVWGRGMTIGAQDERIDEVIQGFLDDPKNRDELTSHQARMQKEVELQTDGNLFFVFFTNQSTGRVRLRTIPFSEVVDIVRNPEDSKEPWYYKRERSKTGFTPEGGVGVTEIVTEYHPDWRYRPKNKPKSIGGDPVHWDRPVFHVKVGGFSDWKFGVPEVYSAIDWAKAYKEFLEDWASIVRAYRRFAFKMSGLKSKGELTAVKGQTETTYAGGGSSSETNPPPVTGAIAILKEGRDLQPIRTAGATVSAEDGRRLLLMVAAAVGLPETFFGDVSVGTLATAKSLDRPTELAMQDRQTLWADVHRDIIDFVLLQAVKAASGPLKGLASIETLEENGQVVEERLAWKEDVDSQTNIDFPPIVERDLEKIVKAIVTAGNLGGFQPAGTIEMRDLSRMLLSALGEPDIDEILARMYPEGEEEAPAWEEQSEEIADAIQGFRESMERLIEKYAGTGSS